MNKRISVMFFAAAVAIQTALCCTSMLVAASHSATGRPMMWKHRDTGAPGNFLERVEASNGNKGYVALFNDGDSLLREAWMGMNDDGFAIMNTASYNVRPYNKNEDGEGLVMSMALAQCASVDDFEQMLDSLCCGPSEIGINANFGVMDANGGLAYFEADDYGYWRFDVGSEGYLIRTNFSVAGPNGEGMGHVRYQNALDLLGPAAESGIISPASFTEQASRSFWQSECKKDFAEKGKGRIKLDNDYIPRSISTSSIVIEGVCPGEVPEGMRMWAALGYPPCSAVEMATLDNIPDDLRPLEKGFVSKACKQANDLRKKATVTGKGGVKYLNLNVLMPIIEQKRQQSLETYKKFGQPHIDFPNQTNH